MVPVFVLVDPADPVAPPQRARGRRRLTGAATAATSCVRLDHPLRCGVPLRSHSLRRRPVRRSTGSNHLIGLVGTSCCSSWCSSGTRRSTRSSTGSSVAAVAALFYGIGRFVQNRVSARQPPTRAGRRARGRLRGPPMSEGMGEVFRGIRGRDWAVAGALTTLGVLMMLFDIRMSDPQVARAIAEGSMVHPIDSHSPWMVPVFLGRHDPGALVAAERPRRHWRRRRVHGAARRRCSAGSPGAAPASRSASRSAFSGRSSTNGGRPGSPAA